MEALNIAVYSGSFNPLHIGHKAIMQYLVSDMGFDMVYLIVSPKNPLKESIDENSGRQRFEAAAEAVARCGMDKVKVDDIELNMPSPQYTFKTLDALQEREPDNKFTLIMGGDQIADIRRWREYRHILSTYGAAVYPRSGFDIHTIREDLLNECPAYKITLMNNAPLVDISSTQIREALAEGIDVSAYLM